MIVETYNCEQEGCGRKFYNDYEGLMDHYKRRHPNLYEKYNKKEDNSNIILNELYNKINLFEKESVIMFDYEDMPVVNYEMENENENYIESRDQSIVPNEEYIDTCKIPDKNNFFQSDDHNYKNDQDEKLSCQKSNTNNSLSQSISDLSNTNKVSIITDEMIGIGTKYEDYDDVDEIDLQERNLICFRTKNNINFAHFLYLTTLNISKNFIKDISHMKHFTTVKILNIKENKIDDISALENLEFLEILYAQNNEISTITSLNKCRNLKILELAENKVKYESSTYKTLQHLNKLKELTIKSNPFLNEVFGYRHLFIYKYPKLSKLDGEGISDVDREIAVKFTQENSVINKERPTTANETGYIKMEESPQEKENETIINRTVAIINDKIITQIDKPEKKSHPLKILKKNSIKNNSIIDKSSIAIQREIEELRNENRILAEKNKSYEMELQSLKIELENSQNLNREYERIIEENKTKANLKDDQDKRKLKAEVEVWKKEYCDLLDKSMSTNVSTSRLLTSGDRDKNNRPQTALTKVSKIDISQNWNIKTSDNLTLFNNESFKMKRKNSLDDSLNNSKSEKEEDGTDHNSDDEIEDLLRKSVTNLSSLKTEIKILSKASETSKLKQNVNSIIMNDQPPRNRSLSKPKIMKDVIEVKTKLFNNKKI